MVEVDARGLSCPEPIMLTAEALKNEKGPIKVLVSEPVQKENVEKYAKIYAKKQPFSRLLLNFHMRLMPKSGNLIQ